MALRCGGTMMHSVEMIGKRLFVEAKEIRGVKN
jgi:hypothetical protein